MKATCPRYLALTLVLLTLSTCQRKKADPQPTDPTASLPLATQTGQRTFGCLFNGQPWTQAGSSFGGPLLNAQYYKWNLNILAIRDTKTNGALVTQSIRINIDSVTSPQKFVFTDSALGIVQVDDLVSNCTYFSDSLHPATVTITRLDLAARIVSGTFSFTLETPGCGPVAVTAGRFDTRF